jgi:protein-L-isoaspartate O-methyltransferase
MTIKEHLTDQFRQPRGPLGRLAGRIMATRGSNVQRNRRTVELLEPADHDHVLEIGYGPGLAIAEIARLVPNGHVTGLDHSTTMQGVATRRLDAAGLSDRVELHVGDVTDLGEQVPGPFDRILAVNVWMFWPDPISVLSSLHSRMAPGGRLAITYQPRHAGASASDTDRGTDQLLEQAEAAGFVHLTAETIPLDDVPAVAVLAHTAGEPALGQDLASDQDALVGEPG